MITAVSSNTLVQARELVLNRTIKNICDADLSLKMDSVLTGQCSVQMQVRADKSSNTISILRFAHRETFVNQPTI